MPGKSTMLLIFCVRQVMEKYREKNRKLCMTFIDLEKTYDRLPREVFEMGIDEERVAKVVGM